MTQVARHDIGNTALKRVRILDQKQSKYGCRTCRQRKVKCDESLPACQRCLRSGRSCAGYARVPRIKVLVPQQHSSIIEPIGSTPSQQPEQQTMARLTLAFFALDPHQLHNKAGAEFSSVLLPQLAATRSYVNAAAGVLGAAYDKCVLRRNDHEQNQLVTKLYLNALRQVQEELQRPEPDTLPLLVSAMLLAAAESIQHRPIDALSHILGAFTMINLGGGTSPEPTYPTSIGPLPPNGLVESPGSAHDVAFSVDYHISMFAWGRSPRFAPLPVTNEMLYPASVEDLTSGHPALQQWCQHFIAKALEPEWEERIDFPPTLVTQQDYLVAWIKRWLRTYTLLFDAPRAQASPRQTSHFRILKAQTLTTFIAVSNVKPPTQVSYDAYAPQFEEIIRCAEHVLNLHSSTPTTPSSTASSSSPLVPYSPLPGIIHPLHFTARRYRDPISRRRAIHLLRHAGIEGPFQGEFSARIAARLVEIEEGRAPFKPVLSAEEVLPMSALEDRRRVYGCWILDGPAHQKQEDEDGVVRRVMKLSRRRGVAPVSRWKEGDAWAERGKVARCAHGMPLQVGPLNNPDGRGKKGYGGGSEMWEVWEEVVVVHG
ncbi:uncharacterized protein HMPREF1541_10227 [Cyphellophora europaea CBS 101466]|uniref:Zn(2)-C6 fungal-type domain-containing protein n=1 Tax=Cyphellophora europaea (strain CBS 101466) TaxID=1220924 RepID=W2S792_CYPE1|nr:uncharacterized protein HMPREF1541_10227 [Cyphellophora europaea CBS 101466]ETN44557.1 hypothetical protein HMPREF1541_10227 [Cyphellophora europaea CBS 101466]